MNATEIFTKISLPLMEELLAGAQIVFHYTERKDNNIILVRRSRTQIVKLKLPCFALYQLTPEEFGGKYYLVGTIGQKMTDLQAIRVAKIMAKGVTENHPKFNKQNVN